MRNVCVVNRSDNPLPKYETSGAAGLDLKAYLTEVPVKVYGANNTEMQVSPVDRIIFLPPGFRALIPTGLFVAVPEGHEMQIRPRSGLALKLGITILNTPGTIDSDYRGEICLIVINHSNVQFMIKSGDRLAQAVLTQVEQVEWTPVNELDETDRGSGGFGHTGK